MNINTIFKVSDSHVAATGLRCVPDLLSEDQGA